MSEYCKMSALQRIAQALGISEEFFFGRNNAEQENVAINTKFDELELISLFKMIQDPLLRQSCLNFVRETAAMTILT